MSDQKEHNPISLNQTLLSILELRHLMTRINKCITAFEATGLKKSQLKIHITGVVNGLTKTEKKY